MSFAVLRIAECEAIASLPEATSRSCQAARTFSARIARVPPGTARTSATQEIEPFWIPCAPGRADDGDAARLEVEHREALRMPHQRLGARAGGEAHLDAARGVRRAEERLRPGRVVAVREDRLRAVHGERLRVGHEPADRELEVAPLLDRALGHHARSPGLRPDEERERVERRVARDADGGLELVEPAPRGLGGVGREQGRALLEIRHVRLVAGVAAGAQLLERHHQLHRVEHPDDAGELRRRQAPRAGGRAPRGARPRRPASGRAARPAAPSRPPRPRGRARARRETGRSRRTRPPHGRRGASRRRSRPRALASGRPGRRRRRGRARPTARRAARAGARSLLARRTVRCADQPRASRLRST